MASPLYRIKLYGHTSDDRDAFVRNLAAILGTDEEGARAALMNVPVVIKEGLPKEKAQSVQETLGLIKALSIMEPTGEETPDSAPGKEEVEAKDADAAKVTALLDAFRGERQAGMDMWSSRIRFAGMLGFATVVLVVLGLFIMSFYIRDPAVEETMTGAVRPPDVSLGELQAEIQDLELDREDLRRENEFLQSQLAERMETLKQVWKGARPDMNRVREVKAKIADNRMRIRANAERMKGLKQKLTPLYIKREFVKEYEERAQR